MKILVTGGTGFIGSYVIAELLREGHDVIAAKRHGSSPVISLAQQPLWLEHNFLELTTSDLEGVDTVIHLASAGVSPQKWTWDELERINIAGSLRLIQLCNQSNVKRLVAAGTCHEYGLEARNWKRIPPNAPLNPVSAYAASKAASFFMLRSFAIANNMEFVYGRIFNTYGEGQYHKNLWPSLRHAALNGSDFPMTDGYQLIDMLPVKTVAQHISTAAHRSDVHAGNPFIVNIGSGVATSVLEFCKRCWKELDASGSLQPGTITPRKNQPKCIVADTDGLIYNQKTN